MPSIKDTSVYILVDGKRLPEYQVDGRDDKDTVAISCHVPCSTADKFHIQIEDKSSFRKDKEVITNVKVTLDGKPMKMQWLLGVMEKDGDDPNEITIKGFSGRNSLHPFVFADLWTTDAKQVQKKFDGIGCIHVEITWCGPNKPYLKYKNDSSYETPALIDDLVSEEAKKITSHRIVFGKPYSQEGINFCTSDRLRKYEPRHFYFYYASRDHLRARNILPPVNLVHFEGTYPRREPQARSMDSNSSLSDDLDGLTPEERMILNSLLDKRGRFKNEVIEL